MNINWPPAWPDRNYYTVFVLLRTYAQDVYTCVYRKYSNTRNNNIIDGGGGVLLFTHRHTHYTNI